MLDLKENLNKFYSLPEMKSLKRSKENRIKRNIIRLKRKQSTVKTTRELDLSSLILPKDEVHKSLYQTMFNS